MIFDTLDVLLGKIQFPITGKYWEERPDTADDTGADLFHYDYIDPASYTYRRLYGNIQSFEAGQTAIRTNDIIDYKIGAYVMTQDGSLYQIIQRDDDFSKCSKPALRQFGVPLGTEFVLRMVKVPNPWQVV